MRLFDDADFDVDEFIELRAPSDIDDDRYAMTAAWAKQWPSEMAWKLTRT